MPRYEKESETDDAVLIHQTKDMADESALDIDHEIDSDLDDLTDLDELDEDQDASETENDNDNENDNEPEQE